ncbi:hypothetical protein ANN_21520 [Periplaneta americana]|uniref:Reverse transcriptase domain-containing protein n=1 Tax=Periplaneta americana TaxID=6978 RepID=A0ABQ8SFI2_PERAM|nr:hypothetical protein ANN_21520 [Periplaneta americana]
MLYKGKIATDNPNSYRGIALENNAFKLLTTILTKRITEMADAQIPQQQFGFRRGRSCLQAVECLLTDIHDALRMPKQEYYTIFIDYTKAFDSVSRLILSQKLMKIAGLDEHTMILVHNILAQNIIKVNDTVTISEGITQTRGILQGDPLSPLLFNIATADVTQVCPPTTSFFIYADDMALGPTKKEDVQETFNRIVNWANENQLQINRDKTVQMTFRRGGRKTDNDTLYYKNEPLKVTNAFKYLRITLQTTTKSFRINVKERPTSAIKAIFDIKNIRQLNLDTATRLFEAKIVPTLTYGIDIIWTYLSLRDLRTMENVKARF